MEPSDSESSSGGTARHAAALVFLTFAILALNCLGVFSWVFFRDYAIVFDGGYRITIGQVPYRDFLMPVGPVVFYLQAFFNLLFGANLWACALHAGSLAAVLGAAYYKITVKKFGIPVSVFMALGLFFSYTGYINYPWYNETAYFFFLMNAMLLIPQTGRPSFGKGTLALSAVLTALAFFSKQDVGILQFGLLSVYFAVFGGRIFWLTVVYYFAATCALGAATVWAWQGGTGNFLACFGLGQAGQLAPRLAIFLTPGRLGSWQFLSLSACALLLLIRKVPLAAKRQIFLAAVLILVPFITQYTSGVAEQTRTQGVPLVLYLGYLLAERAVSAGAWKGGGRILLRLFAGIAVLVFLNPVFHLGRYVTGTVLMQPGLDGVGWVEKARLYFNYIDYVRIREGSYRGCFIKTKVYEDLKKIKTILAATGADFVNLSEYGFLHADFKVKPPAGFPLWFHHGVSFFDGDVRAIRDRILEKRPAAVLLQLAHSHPSVKYVLLRSCIEQGYQYALSAESPAVIEGIEVLVLPERGLQNPPQTGLQKV